MESSQDFNSLRGAIQPALVAVTRSANALANEDLGFQRTVHPTVGSQLDKTTDRMLNLVSGLLKSSSKVTGQSTRELQDVDDVEIKWKGIVDVIDSFLEKADTCLDEYTGLIKRKDAPTFEGRDAKRTKPTERLDPSLKRANIVKPQKAFEKKPNNFDSPWKPILTKKPHAIVPLEQSLTKFINEEHKTQYQHPYRAEIEALQYPSHVFESREPIKYLPVETTKAIWVDTYENVLEMLEELKKAREIAIDLEHHDFRTYNGLLSLMQISTRDKDWIVDTLVPWRHKLEILNEVFADPKIIKVFHGAYMDILWLQRDLGLYVVGLFDTHHASTVLGYGGGSLAFLLKKFVDFDADKKYQLADWRIRPLPEEMLYYARADTHYLLYIYDMIRNDLAATAHTVHPDGTPIERVLERSKSTSLNRREAPSLDPETGFGDRGWYNYLARASYVYNREEFAVFKALWNWRDKTAREEDESPGFIMSQNVMADIVRIMPADKKALWSLMDSHARHLKPRLDDLFDVIQGAKEKGATGQTLLQYFSSTTSDVRNVQINPPAAPAEEASVDIKELKSDQSQLWGQVPLSSAWESGSRKESEWDEVFEIPLYYGTAQAEEERDEEELPDATQPGVVLKPATEYYALGEENKEFTLKAGRKRKASEADVYEGPGEVESEEVEDGGVDVQMEDVGATGEDAGEEDDEEGDDAEAARKAAKQEKKLRRKAAKKAKRAAAMAAEQGEGEEGGAEEAEEVDDEEARREAKRVERKARKAAKKAAKEQEQQEEEGEEEEVFDYSKAASVLKADGEGARSGFGDGDGKKKGRKGGKREKVFDPYAARTTSDVKGVRNRNYERAGRSGTFKK
ncbi:exosome complex exonuclease rrp6 [Triangularia verruculosa]|uniref:Exosome complex exonuclease rrp6 n=1 Tax=Triangularia verruculosa TaxID=2587418 RepID=A0AAN7AQI8_9PEZI|nr:exosome complex exonuclease rrp6 [Triangularia verruculosa]